MPRCRGQGVIDVVVTHAATHDQLAVFEPLDRLARQAEIVIHHDRVGVFDLALQLVFVEGVERRDVGDVAEDAGSRPPGASAMKSVTTTLNLCGIAGDSDVAGISCL